MTDENRQMEIRRRLTEELLKSRAKNPSYSMRAFARKAGIAPSALSEVLNGKRTISQKLAARIADRLMWSPEVLEELESLPRYRKRGTVPQPRSIDLTMDHFSVVSDWHHFAILSLAETKDFKSDTGWIANRLQITKPMAAKALERLERLGMLERGSDGRLFATGVSYASPDEIASLALRKSHAQNLELAKKSLQEDSVEIRDFTSITMAIDPEKIPEAKKMIRQFRNELCAFLESGDKKEVFKFCMQMLPLSKMSQEEES